MHSDITQPFNIIEIMWNNHLASSRRSMSRIALNAVLNLYIVIQI